MLHFYSHLAASSHRCDFQIIPELMKRDPLTESEIADRLREKLPSWSVLDNHLCRVYKTRNWKASMRLANLISDLAEVAWHHPELNIAFSSVSVRLTDHQAGALSAKDFELAERIEQTYGSSSDSPLWALADPADGS